MGVAELMPETAARPGRAVRTRGHWRCMNRSSNSLLVSEVRIVPALDVGGSRLKSGLAAGARAQCRVVPDRADRRRWGHRRRAIVYDSDVLAVTGLGVANQMGFSVPDDVSIVAWDDSLICQVVHPPLTAVSWDIPAYGVQAATRLLSAIGDEEHLPGDFEAGTPVLTPRGSTGPARRAGGAPALAAAAGA